LEYEVAAVSLSSRGAGYGSSQDLDLRFFFGSTTPTSPISNRPSATTTTNFKTPTAAELAEEPWSLNSMVSKYGDQAAAANKKSTPDVMVLRNPKGTLVLGKRGASQHATRQPPDQTSSSSMINNNDNEPSLKRPPSPPAAPRDQQVGAIGSLLALLPPEEGFPIFDPGRPPSAKEPLGTAPRHRFPSLLFERINADYVDQAPLGNVPFNSKEDGKKTKKKRGSPFWGDQTAAGILSLPTSISGGVKQEVPLRPELIARLALAGGLCSAVTRGVTSPIDLQKTRAQSAAATVALPPDALLAGDEKVASSTTVIHRNVPELTGIAAGSMSAVNSNVGIEDPANNWLGLDTSVAAGFAMGAASFGTFEFLKRSLPPLAASTLGPAAPAEFATPILVLACVLQAMVRMRKKNSM
jgi:hypothetical protein